MTNIESQVIRILLEQYKKDNGKKIESLLGKYPKFFEEVYNEYGKHDDLNDFISQLKRKHPGCFEENDFKDIFGNFLSEVREKGILTGLKTLAKDCPKAFEDSAFENILNDLLSKGQNKEQTLGILSVLNSIDKGHRTDKGILTGLNTLAEDCPEAFADDTLKNILKDLVKDKNKEQTLGILDVLNSIDKSYRTDKGILTGLNTLAEDCPEAFEKDNFKNSLKELLLKGQNKEQTSGILSVLNSIDTGHRTDKDILTGLNTLAEDCPEAFADDTLKNILKDLVKDKNKEQTLGILDVLNSIDKRYRADEGILTGLKTLATDCPEAFEKDNFKNSLKELLLKGQEKDLEISKKQTSGILSVLNSIDKGYRTDEDILTGLNTLAEDCPYIFEDRKDDTNYKSGCQDIIKLLQATQNNLENDKPERILNVLSLLKKLDRENFFSQHTDNDKEANLSQDSRCNKQIYYRLTELAQKKPEAFATENIQGLEGFLGGSDVFQMVGKLDLLNSLSKPLNTTKLRILTELIDSQTGSNVITDESGKQIMFSTFLKNKGGEALKSLDSLNASSTEEAIKECKTKLEECKKEFMNIVKKQSTTTNSPSDAVGGAGAQPVDRGRHIENGASLF